MSSQTVAQQTLASHAPHAALQQPVTGLQPPAPPDADLQTVLPAWDTLPTHLRAAIVAIATATEQWRHIASNPRSVNPARPIFQVSTLARWKTWSIREGL